MNYRLFLNAGLSAKTLNRPGLQSTLASLDNGEAQALVVVKLDRLTRPPIWIPEPVRYFGRRFTLMSAYEATHH